MTNQMRLYSSSQNWNSWQEFVCPSGKDLLPPNTFIPASTLASEKSTTHASLRGRQLVRTTAKGALEAGRKPLHRALGKLRRGAEFSMRGEGGGGGFVCARCFSLFPRPSALFAHATAGRRAPPHDEATSTAAGSGHPQPAAAEQPPATGVSTREAPEATSSSVSRDTEERSVVGGERLGWRAGWRSACGGAAAKFVALVDTAVRSGIADESNGICFTARKLSPRKFNHKGMAVSKN